MRFALKQEVNYCCYGESFALVTATVLRSLEQLLFMTALDFKLKRSFFLVTKTER